MYASLLVGIEHAELVSLFLEPFDGEWQGCAELVDAFQRVVECDNAAVAGILFHISVYLVGIEQSTVIACDEVPHYYSKVPAKSQILQRAHPAFWWAEEVCAQQAVCQMGIPEIFLACTLESSYVVECMVSQPVPASFHFVLQAWVFPHVVANHEESGLDIELVEYVENDGCSLWDRAVIECEIDGLLLRVHPPDGTWIEPSQPLTWLFDYHPLQLESQGFCSRCELGVDGIDFLHEGF